MELDTSKRIPILVERLLKQSLPAEQLPRYKPYFLRLLAMNISVPSNNEKNTLKKILKRVDPRKLSQFQELYTKLQKNKTLSSKKHILYLLYRIHESPLVSVFPLEIPKKSKSFLKISTFPEISARPVLNKLEKELMQDIVCILQGSEGKYIKYSNLEDRYHVQTSYIFYPLAKMLDEITELACLHRKIQRYLMNGHLCQASQALVCTLQNELIEYYHLITLFQTDPDMTLRKIYLWVAHPIERLKWMTIICEAAETLRGSEIISAVYSYIAMGDPVIQKIIYKVLDDVASSLMHMIEVWITEGEIRDPYHEFFISENLNISDEQLWLFKFVVVPEHVPVIFSQKMVETIFLIGKTINFIKSSCKKDWNSFSKKPRPHIYSTEAFESWIKDTANLVNKHLFEILFDQYHLASHFLNIKKIFLVGQGDFHHSLIEQLVELLKTKEKMVYKYDLRSVLENAIRNSNLQNESQDFLNLLDIKLLDRSGLDLGWDIFTLDYLISSPLTVIFTEKIMATYRKIFKFLWHAKRAMFYLGQFQCIRTLISFQNNSELYEVIQMLMILRQAMRHFINNLISYILLEIIEKAWKRFYSKLFCAQNLDELIFLHNKFLETLLKEMLLSDPEIYSKTMKLLELCIRTEIIWLGLFEVISNQMPVKKKDFEIISLEELEQFTEYSNDIQNVTEQFKKELTEFTQILASSEDPQQKFLAFRLDFNEYYQFQQFVLFE